MNLYVTRYYLAATIMILSGVCNVRAQDADSQSYPKNVAPVLWQMYSVRKDKIAVKLPKLPILMNVGNNCRELDGLVAYAYAEHAVYEFRFYKKAGKISEFCSTKERFGQNTMDRRLQEINHEKPDTKGETNLGERKAKTFVSTKTGKVTKRWLVPDMTASRWFELAIHHREGADAHEQQFFESLVIGSSTGVDLKTGSDATLGDAEASTNNVNDGSGAALSDGPLAIIAKPRPGYTEAARRANTQGSVILRATFLPNGSIGGVSVVKGLPAGLTEQAARAARRIVFLPKQANGGQAVTRQIEYTFSIY